MLLYQPESGYCYNSDSIFLYNFINTFKPKGKMLDVGSGCGIVGLLVARDNPRVSLEGVEKQKAFMEYTKINARVNKIEYTLHEQEFLELNSEYKYDYIISNPPFYPMGAKKSEDEMLLNARYNDNLPMADFFKKVSRLLKPNSHFIFCYDATQFFDVCTELQSVKMRICDVRFVHSKVDRTASLVLVHARNGSKSMMKVHPPLIHMDENEYSKEAQEIYDKAKTQSIKCQI
ncbi:methyltransferase [Sulfurimonas aquatica]|uniref:Methyltransferase n=1 Tax=Sulfurimonas aquatica TaxID=2672570 RepID=A0A975GDE6_9BACT|nr:methyltransferase [Sulfurimonas aquatica]QSZ42278.1 methyltransferase [Sulfurimonas aquatica]